MPEAYKKLITKTFRDDAIRSVLLIDDDYNSYIDLSKKQKELIDEIQKIAPSLNEGEQPPKIPEDSIFAKQALQKIYEQLEILRELSNKISTSFKRTSVASEFVKFFHDETYICDVENKVNFLNPDKVRKSDLIILDYCLSESDSSQSLQLLRNLSCSKHLNLVVIYTNQPLKRVWLEVAATLRSSKVISPTDYLSEDIELLKQWGDAEEEYKQSWTSLSRKQVIRFILGEPETVIEEVTCQFWDDIQEHDTFDYEIHKKPTNKIISYLCECDIRKNILLADGGSSVKIHGKDELWIQCGEIFIALCEKKNSSQEEIAQQPQAVWQKLEEALHDWYPNFYRIVLSELQNRIEDSNFCMSKKLSRPEHEQIALLWSILKEHPDKQLNVSESLLRYLLRDISDELLQRNDKNILEFIKSAALNSLNKSLIHVKLTNKNREEHNDFIRKTVKFAKENYKGNIEKFDTNFCLNIAHAFNERTTTLPDIPSYITTGMVLKSKKSSKTSWYMCVTPSCDTVPEQKNADNAAQLDPHRLLTFAKLKPVDLAEALANAHQSSYIFISDNDLSRIALSVIDPETKQPDLVKLVVVNHNKRILINTGQKALKLKNKDEGIKTEEMMMIPIVLLAPNYAARYQAVQSHHEGRIGVDFTTADFSEPVNAPNEKVDESLVAHYRQESNVFTHDKLVSEHIEN